jgi:nanoRNase/pAp phosphatase (c-di-AMP/oligoRNAs hydrolase)
MRHVLVCPDEFLWRLLDRASGRRLRPVHVVERPAAAALIRRRGGHVVVGDLEDEAVYRRAAGDEPSAFVLAVPRPRQRAVQAAVADAMPEAPVVVLGHGRRAASGRAVTVPLGDITARLVVHEVERALLRGRLERIRAHFRRAGRVLIMMQDDPDPDAIASALAFRALLNRTRAAAPMGTFGTIARPENRAMTRILGIEVDQVKPRALDDFDMIAVVDAQPAFFEETFPRLDLVIDHHPKTVHPDAALVDIRPGYGATSTILTEYLRAAGTRLTPRLATALVYGITTDTLHLERGATPADLEAFAFLHPHANHNALRRIERPELPDWALDTLAAGIGRRRLVRGVLFSHVGEVRYPELIAQFADLLLQVEGAAWSVVSGVVNGDLHVSVRNVGWVRGAGDVMRAAFGTLGKAGGHRSMAKAIVRLDDWRARVGDTSDAALEQAVADRVLTALESGPLQ